MVDKPTRLFDVEQMIQKGVANPEKAMQYAIDELSPYARIPQALLTLPIKIKPDFFIIGAAKCGTTSLREYVQLHDSIRMRKELAISVPNQFWQTDHWRNRARYHSVLDRWTDSDEYKTFEKNVGYLCDFRIPRRVQEHNPGANFIVLMRDPVDRTISQYYHNRRKSNRESLSFQDALEREESRIEPERVRMEQEPQYPMTYYGRYAYRRRSQYVEQLEPWLDYFPRERFLFLEFEEFFSNSEQRLQDVFEFVGVSEQPVTIDRKFNSGDYEADFDSELIADLEDEFKPYNERLYDLVGRDFGWGY